MTPLYGLLLLTLFAGLAMPLGALIAHFERITPEWLETELMHGITAFGGGALLSAISLVLVPEGIGHFSTSGGRYVVSFRWHDVYVSRYLFISQEDRDESASGNVS